jgi:glycosyltransferase involved in cell wall biosynthesis
LHILHVIDTTGPGGAETLFVELCRNFSDASHRSSALLHGNGWVRDQLIKNGMAHYVHDCKGSFNIRFLAFLVRLLRSEQVDVLQSHLLGSNVYCSLAGLLTGTPVVATFHGSVDIAPNERFMAAKFALINRATAVVCVSEALEADLLQRTSIDPAKLKIIKNGIDCRRFAAEKHDALKRERALPEEAFVVGSLGNLRPAKDYPTALRAMARVVARDPSVHWVVAGDIKHELHRDLSELGRQLGVAEHVHFLGFYEPAEKFLSGIDLYLLSSNSEGHPFSVLQAMAAGLPIVATRCGVESMLVDGDTAALVDVGSPQQIAEQILALKAAPLRRAQLGRSAQRQAVSTYDFSATAREYLELYRKAMQ